MEEHTLKAARAVAAGRVAVGATLCVAPNLAAPWAGEAARTPGARMIIRALGARDAALGLGTLAAAHDPPQLRRWLMASSACDAVDFGATLAGPRSRARSLVLGLAATAMVVGLGAAAAI
jgi:hypothetical protein